MWLLNSCIYIWWYQILIVAQAVRQASLDSNLSAAEPQSPHSNCEDSQTASQVSLPHLTSSFMYHLCIAIRPGNKSPWAHTSERLVKTHHNKPSSIHAIIVLSSATSVCICFGNWALTNILRSVSCSSQRSEYYCNSPPDRVSTS